jgi:hypothetical protein
LELPAFSFVVVVDVVAAVVVVDIRTLKNNRRTSAIDNGGNKGRGKKENQIKNGSCEHFLHSYGEFSFGKLNFYFSMKKTRFCEFRASNTVQLCQINCIKSSMQNMLWLNHRAKPLRHPLIH